MFFFRKTSINDALKDCRNTPGAVLMDVREADEFRSGHIPGAVNVPLPSPAMKRAPADAWRRGEGSSTSILTAARSRVPSRPIPT